MAENEKNLTLVENSSIVGGIGDGSNAYNSLPCNTQSEKIAFYNAINNPEKRVSDSVNIPIAMIGFYAEDVQCANEKTGELETCPRIVIMDKNGCSYVAVSFGVLSALKKLVNIFGEPTTWEKPIVIVPKTITKGNKNITTLQLAEKQ